MNYKKIDRIIFKYLILIAIMIIAIINFNSLIAALSTVLNAFSNIIFAAMLAYVINIVMSRIEKLIEKAPQPWLKKIKRPLSLILSLIFIVVVICSLINLVVPEFIRATQVLINALPTYFEQMQSFLVKLFADIPQISNSIYNIEVDWQNLFSKIFSFLSSGISSVIGQTFNLVTMITNSLFNLLMIFIFSIYLLLDKERFLRLYHRLTKLYLSKERRDHLLIGLKIIDQSFSSFIAGQCIEAVILGSLCAIGMAILQLPYAIMIGILVGSINIIPIVGAYVGGAVGVFMVFTVSPFQAVIFLIYLCILQQIESNLIYPRVVGNSVGLPGVYVLASVMVFGTLAGIPGMFLGIPTVASIYKISKLYIERKERQIKAEL